MTRHLVPAALVLSLMLAACGAGPGAAGPSTVAQGPEPTRADTAGVLVVATGTITTAPDGSTELCPPGWIQPCPGIRVESEVAIPEVPMVSLTGRYDGARIVVSDAVAGEWADAATIDFTTPCEELREGEGAPQAPDAAVVAVDRVVAKRNAEVGGSWWDRENGVYTVWLVGDPQPHRGAVEAAAGDMPVCVIGGAEWTQKELNEAQRKAARMLAPTDMLWHASTDTLGNRSLVVVEAIDQEGLDDLERRFGGRVEVDSFIELVEDDLSDLPDPVPAHPGNLVLLTPPTRFGGGMMALGQFTLRFDRERRCTYLDGNGERMIAIWPFGFSADAGPARVYDFDGNVVLRQGDSFEIAGGWAGGIEGLPASTDTCGADAVFIASTSPTLIGSK
jgi:hypothetical protein